MVGIIGVFSSLAPLGEHHWCCVKSFRWVSLPGGQVLVVAHGAKLEARSHLTAAGTLLPSPINPAVLTAAQVALFPAAWGITAADTGFTAAQKIVAATGIPEFDPET